ncbi:Cytochrome C oxidase subunit IV [Cupriavidus sp. H19C3]
MTEPAAPQSSPSSSSSSSAPPAPPASSLPTCQSVPAGFRQGLITAITVLLGFSLAFWQFWGLEASGRWNARAMFAGVCLLVAVVLEIVSLFRALRIEDDAVEEYRKTVQWFIASALALVVGLAGAMVDAALAD